MFRFAGFSSIWSLISAPFRLIWRVIRHFFPERDFIVMSGGAMKSFRQSSFWYFSRTMGKGVLIVWAFWATYTFIYHRPMLQNRTRQLEETRMQHARHMSDLETYQKKFNELARELNIIDDHILKGRNISKSDADALMKQRLNIWAQLDFLQAKLSELLTDAKYEPEIVKISELSLEYDLTREENKHLRAQNVQMEAAMQTVYIADSVIVDHVLQLTEGETGALSKELKKISGTLASLGLNEKTLAERATKINNPTVGAAVPPILFDKDIDPKYQELADKINLWQGLSRAELMLPMGAPVKAARITSSYGTRDHPIDGVQKKHTGIDFAGTIGTPLFAVAPGRIVFVGERSGYGKTVEIDHGLGFTTLYAHLSKINVDKGDWVNAKEIVGLGGSSGKSTGPHLHYEIRYNNSPFNPYSFVKGGPGQE
jgi:murein DD-endopeptidase MepM/ murein hydrolase activator NlpD